MHFCAAYGCKRRNASHGRLQGNDWTVKGFSQRPSDSLQQGDITSGMPTATKGQRNRSSYSPFLWEAWVNRDSAWGGQWSSPPVTQGWHPQCHQAPSSLSQAFVQPAALVRRGRKGWSWGNNRRWLPKIELYVRCPYLIKWLQRLCFRTVKYSWWLL